MKLFFKNTDFLKNNEDNYQVKRTPKSGSAILPIIAAVAMAVSTTTVTNMKVPEPPKKNNKPAYAVMQNINVDKSRINELNIILNNQNCSNELFQEVCDSLRDDGIVFQTTSNGLNINQDNATIITIDQEYSEGEDTIIFAPHNNTRIGHSDSLAIAMHSAFDQNGFIMGNIQCSKIGYNSDNEVDFSLPTDTENAIDEGCDTSFVTVSFGNNNVNAKWVAKSIENGLARQAYYLDNFDSHTDLIYRASKEDSLIVVSDYFRTSPAKLKDYNQMKKDEFNDSQTIINPEVENYGVFDRRSVFELDGVKTKAY